MTSPAYPEYIAWRRISERGLGYDLPDFAMEVVLFLMNNAGDDGISRGGEGNEDDAVIDSPYPRTEIGQTIDFNFGQGSHVHAKKGNNFSPERQMTSARKLTYKGVFVTVQGMPRAHRDKGQGSRTEAMGMDWNGLRDRFKGSAIGTFIGDAMGRVVEGWPASAIRRSFGLLEDMTEGIYTDDTEMMMGIMESLREAGWFDPSLTAGKFLHNFNPTRGYGGRIYGVMDRLRRGIPWNQAGTDSWGNGSAMRVAPIGFFFYDDSVKLREAAIQSSIITHKHPKGIAGAVAQATAVGIATRKGLRGESIEVEGFTDLIIEDVVEIDQEMAYQLERIKGIKGGDFRATIDAIGSFFYCDVSAIGAVPPAIASFLLTRGFRESVVVAVNCGGDTDTLGAMSGAIAGAYYGYGQIPRQWLSPLENEGKGRDYILSLAEWLAEFKGRDINRRN